MIVRNALLISATSVCLAWTATVASAQAPSATQTAMKSPAEVQRALSALNRVVDHMQRLMTAKNYSQLPRESSEFNDGSQALERSIASEPADFKNKVEVLLRRADGESKSLADASKTSDQSKLQGIHAELASTVKQIFSAFPGNVQPSPPNLAEEGHEDRTGTTGAGR
jgi:hypothetical protein